MKIKLTKPHASGTIVFKPGWVIEVGSDTGALLIAAGHQEVPEEQRAKKNPELYSGGCFPDALKVSPAIPAKK